ncbi:MAG: ATP-binding protein [Desulfobacterales bacterium]|nr:ATP-binding protein [Desulfobacterales bacterium]
MKTIGKRQLYRNLRLRIIGLTLVVAITPLVLLGGAIYDQFARAHENRIEDQIRLLANSQSNAVEVFLRERITLLSMMVETYDFDELSRQEVLSRLFETLNRRNDMLGLVDLGVIDSSGLHVSYVGPFNLKGFNYEQQPWFGEAMTKGTYVSDVYLGFRLFPHFIIAVRGRSGEHQWILRATIDSEVFNRLVRTAQAGRMGDAFIINENGIFQTKPRFDGEILDNSQIDPNLFNPGTTMVAKMKAQGTTFYHAGAWLKHKKWLLVIRQQADDEVGGLLHTRNTAILIVSLGVLAIVITTIFTAHIVVRHLEEGNQKTDALSAQLVQSDKLAALGKMATGIAHEINNPLAVIGEKAGWMKDLLDEEEFKNSPNLQEYLSSVLKIEEHVERARKITHNMLGFARRMEPRLDDVEVNGVVDQTLELLTNHARISNIEIRKNYAPNLPVIASDRSQLQQVMLNLINNAIDAIGSNGCIEVSTNLDSNRIAIQVKDDGPGIPKDKQRNIFDPFFTTKANGRGTGLGLSISYSIIEKLGGTITFRSEPGEGTTFSVYLPLVAPEKK